MKTPPTVRRARRIVSCGVLTCAAAVALSIAPLLPQPSALAAEEVVISVTLLQGYSPKSVQIETGTTVIWRNDDEADLAQYPVGRHQVRAEDGSFESPVLPPGAQFASTFLMPGTIAYRCVLHPQLMSGEVVATGEPITEAKDEAVSIVERPGGDYGFDPKDLVIPVGTTVTWRNNGTIVHTATAKGVFDSGDLGPGEKFSFTFDEPLSIRYVCTPHKEFMTGTIRVAAKGGKPPPPPPPDDPPESKPVAAPTQAPRAGNEPATFNVLAVEPGAVTSWGFSPPSLRIRAGDTVVWRNSGSATHTVTAADGSFDSGDLVAGATFRRTFDAPATLPYACTPHPWMKGTIVVVPATAGGKAGPVDVPVDAAPGTGVPTPMPEPGQGAPGSNEGDGDTAAALRAPFAIGTGAAIVLLGALLVLPSLVGRRRTGPPEQLTLDLSALEEREPAGVT